MSFSFCMLVGFADTLQQLLQESSYDNCIFFLENFAPVIGSEIKDD